jgi:hypothetical protein
MEEQIIGTPCLCVSSVSCTFLCESVFKIFKIPNYRLSSPIFFALIRDSFSNSDRFFVSVKNINVDDSLQDIINFFMTYIEMKYL